MNGQALAFAKAPGWISRILQDKDGIKVPEGGGEVKHDFTLHPGATVRGRVTDAAGKGVAGAEVVFESGTGMGFEGFLFGTNTAVTGPDGGYVLFDLEEGKVPEPTEAPSEEAANPFLAGRGGGPRVRASAAGYVPARSEPFEVGPGASVTAPTVRLLKGAVVKGRVTEPGGKPVAGAVVDVEVEGGASTFEEILGMGGTGGAPRTLHTAADGTFTAETVPAGRATFTARAPGWASSRAVVTVEGEASPAPFDLRMRPAREVRGRVLGPDGSGVKGASVSVDGASPPDAPDAYVAPVAARTDGEGAFVLKGLPPGRHEVRVTASGFRAEKTQADAGSTVEVRLSPVTAGSAERLKEIQGELQEIYGKFAGAKDKTEREALQRRMMELMKEQTELQGGDGAAMD
jgi:protocatechuate 3,4-dioxygenase beta subunit